MGLGKKDITKNISFKAHISYDVSENFLNTFIELIKSKSKYKVVKISKFGSFYRKISPERAGRNPKTREEFLITERSKLILKTSNNIKGKLN